MKFIEKIKEKIRKYCDTHNFTCDVCGREVFASERVCARCRAELPWNDGYVCPICGRREKEAGICLECKEEPLGTDAARSVFVHEGTAVGLVNRFKRGQKYLYRTLCDYLAPKTTGVFPDAEALVFVPMTKRARKKRGYNQSELLCEELSRRTGLPVLRAAEKTKETKAQKTLTRAQRRENLEDCFRVTDRAAVKGKRLLVIDDTLTTGATVSALAEKLKRAGAARVYALTFTSVEKKFPFGIPPRISAKKDAYNSSEPKRRGK